MECIELENGKKIYYQLTRKQVKNINMRIGADGVVRVSANNRVSEQYIKKLLTDGADKIIEAQNRMEAREKKQIQSVDEVKWLGSSYPVRVIANSRETVILEDNELRVFTNHPERKEKYLNQWLADNFMSLSAELNEEVYSTLEKAGRKPPFAKITIKNMSTRWGSCTKSGGRISINIRLAAFPKETILAVFWHEYSHFYVQNHSKQFYDFLLSFYPDYYKWHDVLK